MEAKILIPYLPYPAWRLLIDYLPCDKAFCNHIYPNFQEVGVTVYIHVKVQERPKKDRHTCAVEAVRKSFNR